MKTALLALIVASSALHADDAAQWTALPTLPDPEGFAGMYAGVSHNVLLAAGGANFPSKKPWEGGTKAWYDTVWMLDKPMGKWTAVGKLPSARGYGASVSTEDGLLCIGGADAAAHTTECLLLTFADGQLKITQFPNLPQAYANCCGARVGDVVYVAGGILEPTSTVAMKTFWALDLRQPEAGWKALNPWPGPERMLAVAGAHDGAFYLMSGVSLAAGPDGKPVRTYLKDAWSYRPESGWKSLAELPRAAVAAPSPSWTQGGSIHILGGDDGELVNFEPKSQHPGFPKTSLTLDVSRNVWITGKEMSSSVVTNPATIWNGAYVIVSGEKRPGVRSPLVWSVE